MKKSSSFISTQSMPSEVEGALLQSVVSMGGTHTVDEGASDGMICAVGIFHLLN